MKKYKLLILCFFLTLYSQIIVGQAQKVTVGFQKDTISIQEGDSCLVAIQLLGIIPEGKKIKIEFKVTKSDATETKDYLLPNKDPIDFYTSPSSSQSQIRYFQLKTVSDMNQENEQMTISLSSPDSSIFKFEKKEILVIIKDYKTNQELQLEEFKKEITTAINKVTNIVNNDRDTSEVIGVLRIKNFHPKVYTWNMNKKDTSEKKDSLYEEFKNSNGLIDPMIEEKIQGDTNLKASISKVDIFFTNGIATEIKAYDENSKDIYRNLWNKGYKRWKQRFGVSFRHKIFIDRYKYYHLISDNESLKTIKLLDLLDYDAETQINFAPNDGKITLTKEHSNKKLTVNTSLNSYINLNIYSDLLSLLKSDRSNGLVQTEASARIFLNTMPLPKSVFLLFNYFEPSLKYSRFDNGYESIIPTKLNKSLSTKDTFSIDRMSVNQRKFLEIGGKVNVFKKMGRFYNSYELNVFSNFGWFNLQGEKLKDSLNSNVPLFQTSTGNTLDFGAEVKATILQYRNFGLNIGGSVRYQKIWNNKDQSFVNGGFQWFFAPEYELFYFPIANSKDKIFLRAKYLSNTNENERNFVQLQFGYKVEFKLPNSKLK
ncbi:MULTISPECIES: hypothetical protein [unclassified Arcicella]|uniref:hypothetical protein n=1 Tax=unclassified Arcicella TaxID=2644986 RepID=UPI0028631667|nr:MULTISPECIES: hypothetical protein [unclassified Arcicella]MDR6561326.1 hypothetical protein [Arcicella sp. BE51]MDR6811210.1 hypothetical protein [Arcicella sp. BE140]MDR6822560.1 hypothetical protein [Arcicella sp. BE139]